MIVDPVCSENLDDVEYPEVEEYNSRYYYFESLECAQKFRREPDKYVAGREEELGEPIPGYLEKAQREGRPVMPIDLSKKQSIEEITNGRIKKKPREEVPAAARPARPKRVPAAARPRAAERAMRARR